MIHHSNFSPNIHLSSFISQLIIVVLCYIFVGHAIRMICNFKSGKYFQNGIVDNSEQNIIKIVMLMDRIIHT